MKRSRVQRSRRSDEIISIESSYFCDTVRNSNHGAESYTRGVGYFDK